jgi:hypothetical protein
MLASGYGYDHPFLLCTAEGRGLNFFEEAFDLLNTPGTLSWLTLEHLSNQGSEFWQDFVGQRRKDEQR